MSVESDAAPPISNLEMEELRSYQVDPELALLEEQASRPLPDISNLPTPELVSDLTREYWVASNISETFSDVVSRAEYFSFSELAASDLSKFQLVFRRVAEQISTLERRPEPWTRVALVDVLHLKSNPWYSRRSQIVSLIGQLKLAVSELNPSLQSRCVGDPAQFKPVATALLQYLQGGGRIKTTAPGVPRVTLPSSRERCGHLHLCDRWWRPGDLGRVRV